MGPAPGARPERLSEVRVRPVHWRLDQGSSRRSLVHFQAVDDWLGYDDSLRVLCGVNRACYDLLPNPEPQAALCRYCLRSLGKIDKRGRPPRARGRASPLMFAPRRRFS